MPKQTLKSIVPSVQRVRAMRGLNFLGDWIYDANLWHINRYSASMAFFVGLFVAFLPVPGQMPIAALLAVLLKCNLPLSVCLVWVTNPLTMTPIYFISYKVGGLILDQPVDKLHFELSFAWLSSRFIAVWKPFLLGCVVCGLSVGSLGYFVVNQLWRWRTIYLWRQRRRRREQRLRLPG